MLLLLLPMLLTFRAIVQLLIALQVYIIVTCTRWLPGRPQRSGIVNTGH